MNTKIIEIPGRRRRRIHGAEFKASVIAACQHSGVSIASVALTNGLNANMLRKWVGEAERAEPRQVNSRSVMQTEKPSDDPQSPGFIPVQLPMSASAADIHIELLRSGTSIKVKWPASAAAECGAWLQALLR